MKQIVTLALLLILSISVLAQHNFKPGSIYKSGEIIQGEIDSKSTLSHSKKCIFRTRDQLITTYSPSEIEGYDFENGKRYISMAYKDTVSFFEYLVEGRISLYYLKDPSGDHFLVSKEGDELKELVNSEKKVYIDNYLKGIKERKEYIGTLSILMSDAPSLSSQIKESQLNHKSLIELIKKYHETVCPEEVCHIYEKRNETRISLGPEVGFTNSALSVQSSGGYTNVYTGRDASGSNAVSFGGKINANGIFGINEKICPSLNLLYSSHKYLFKAGNGRPKEEVSTSFLKAGLSINYEFINNRRWVPYFGIGYSVDYFLKNNMIDRLSVIESAKNAYDTKYQMNPSFNTGIKYKLNPKMTLDMCFVYENGSGLVNWNMSGWSTDTNNVSLRIALLFHRPAQK